MQVDYRAEVVKTAGDKFGELDSLMSHLQTRSLELTCHLRGFVYYMMDRRTVEEDILAQSGEDKFFPSAMSWFDRAQSRLTLGHSYLVAIISRVLMRQLESTCQSKSSTIVSLSDSEVASSLNGDATPSPSPADSNPAAADANPVTADSNPVSVPPLDRPELSSAPSPRSDLKSVEPNPLPVNARFEKSIKQLYANDIIKLLEPAIKLLKTVKLSRQKNSMPCDEVRKIIKEAMESTPGLLEKRDEIVEKLKVTRLLIPFLSVNVPVNVLYQFHSAVLKFEPNDPKFKQFLTHERFGPSLSEFDILLRRLKWSDEVICVLVHSSYDNSVVAFPAVTGAGIAWPESRAAMYPLCAACKRDFGTSVCRACGVARYCSKICQNDAWTKHSTECKVWAQFAERQKMVVL